MDNSTGLLKLARSAAATAAAYLRATDRPAPDRWDRKGQSDFVTAVDRTSEELVRQTLLAGEPGSTVVGEELAPELVTGGLVWVVDPLDGTTNFLHGVPGYCVSIAAAVEGTLRAGVILEASSGREYHARAGGGAWCGDRRLAVSAITDPADALIGTGFPFREFGSMARYLEELGRFAARTSGIRRIGSAALDLALVAAGTYEGFWEHRLSAWDIAAGTLLVREAGGRVTDFGGRDLGIEHGPVLAGNPAIHGWMMGELGRG